MRNGNRTGYGLISFPQSSLYNQDTFYKTFSQDLRKARSLVVIESPFITKKRIDSLLPIITRLTARGVHTIVNTKPLEEHTALLYNQALRGIGLLKDAGVEVLMTVGHHRKIAIIDDEILYEGSLNILSQNDSCEMMRKIKSRDEVKRMLRFIGLKKWCK